MAHIPEDTKAELKNSGVRFNRDPLSERSINGDLLAVAKRAVGNAIKDDEPYTIRINFRNGRIVGREETSKITVELLSGRAATPVIGVPTDSNVAYVEFTALTTEGFASITNEGRWVAHAKFSGDDVSMVVVNSDFDEEDRELIKTVLLRGFEPQIQM